MLHKNTIIKHAVSSFQIKRLHFHILSVDSKNSTKLCSNDLCLYFMQSYFDNRLDREILVLLSVEVEVVEEPVKPLVLPL